MAKLTEKQKLFANEYLIDLNATRAYKKIYKAVKSDEVAAAAGNRLLRNVKVENYIAERIKDREKRTEITQDKVLKELAKIAFTNGSDFAKVVTKQKQRKVWNESTQEYDDVNEMDQYVELIDTEELSKDKRAAISSIKEGKHGIEVSSYDKVKALELIGRHIGMFKDKLEITGQVNNPMEGLTTEELKKLINDDKTAT